MNYIEIPVEKIGNKYQWDYNPVFILSINKENRILDTDYNHMGRNTKLRRLFKERQKLLIKIIKSYGEPQKEYKLKYNKCLLDWEKNNLNKIINH